MLRRLRQPPRQFTTANRASDERPDQSNNHSLHQQNPSLRSIQPGKHPALSGRGWFFPAACDVLAAEARIAHET